jgi:hypothetical protein
MSECRNVGMSEWEDCKVRKVIVPIRMDGQMIHHCVSRSVRHISIITCISTARESLKPYIVTSQDSDDIRKRLMIHGVRLGVDFVLRHRLKSYVNRKLFRVCGYSLRSILERAAGLDRILRMRSGTFDGQLFTSHGR